MRSKTSKKARVPGGRRAACESGAERAFFPVVGIGASAGGLAAFEAFFSGMPRDSEPGMAFVLVQHLAPDHKSILCELVRRYTRMQVFEVEDGMVVQPNCTYIIPPGRDMGLINGALQLFKPSAERGQRLPIDFFFRSLAQDQREKAIGIVLSGTGADGTLGVRAIKGEDGMVIAQKPESAEFDGMPRSAIGTGLVDYELPAAEMPAKLAAYAAHIVGRRPPDSVPAADEGNALGKIFILLRAQTGHDFSLYKPSTIKRRTERRMALQQIDRLDSYVKYLARTPAEVDALFRDFLINVTRFFRDPEAFLVLEKTVIPQLVEGRPAGTPVRIWVPGCSTGEEAYSIAMLLAERQDLIKQGCALQIFATDIDSRAIAVARTGIYPASIAVDVSPERLARFFTADADGGTYRINKNIRDMMVFSEQDVIKDPPFSRLDLISCRNLLIYLGAELQQKLIPLFHYALNPGGVLFLGNSESAGEPGQFFSVVDQKAKLYRRNDHGVVGRIASLPLTPSGAVMQHSAGRKAAPAAKVPLRELAEREMLQHAGLVGALVDERGDVLYLHGRTGLYLEPPPGEPGANNILKMAREGLRPGLASALRKAAALKTVARAPGQRVKTNGHFAVVDVTVRPVARGAAGEAPLFAVILEEAPAAARPPKAQASRKSARGAAPPEPAAVVAALKEELRAKEEYLRSANEELQSTTEELQSSNEEMQSVNEELQSSNEELETSKEELQSVNEELSTVNAELQTKVLSLSQANNDMNNLMAGTGIGTVFVDHQLRIVRFTPAVSPLLNLIQSDLGRPVAHIVSNLAGYDRLVDDARQVLDTLVPKEQEVRTKDGRTYSMRIMPYRTLENVIEGAVISFLDISEMARVREALRQANDLFRLAVVVRESQDALTVQDLDGRIIAWNPGAARMYGWSESEALGMNMRDLIPPAAQKEESQRTARLARGEILPAHAARRLAKDGKCLAVEATATALIDGAEKVYAIASTERMQEERE